MVLFQELAAARGPDEGAHRPHTRQADGPQDAAGGAELDLYCHHGHDRLEHAAEGAVSKAVPAGLTELLAELHSTQWFTTP